MIKHASQRSGFHLLMGISSKSFQRAMAQKTARKIVQKHLTQVCSQGTASIRRKLSEECEGTVIAGLGISQGPACEVREGMAEARAPNQGILPLARWSFHPCRD